MPHFALHYSANLGGFDAASCLVAVNSALAASRHFEEVDIKSRALRIESYEVGTHSRGRGFVAAQLSILEGRSDKTKKELSETVLKAILGCSTLQAIVEVQVTVEVIDIHRASYAKTVLGEARFLAEGNT